MRIGFYMRCMVWTVCVVLYLWNSLIGQPSYGGIRRAIVDSHGLMRLFMIDDCGEGQPYSAVRGEIL